MLESGVRSGFPPASSLKQIEHVPRKDGVLYYGKENSELHVRQCEILMHADRPPSISRVLQEFWGIIMLPNQT